MISSGTPCPHCTSDGFDFVEKQTAKDEVYSRNTSVPTTSSCDSPKNSLKQPQMGFKTKHGEGMGSVGCMLGSSYWVRKGVHVRVAVNWLNPKKVVELVEKGRRGRWFHGRGGKI